MFKQLLTRYRKPSKVARFTSNSRFNLSKDFLFSQLDESQRNRANKIGPVNFYIANVQKFLLNPNPDFCEKSYLNLYSDVRRAVDKGSFLCGYDHYLRFGFTENRTTQPAHTGTPQGNNNSVSNRVLDSFDESHYLNQLASKKIQVGEKETSKAELFEHFVKEGRKIGLNPNLDFNEIWYVSTYSDIEKAIATNDIMCGFEHWVLRGQSEGRKGTFDKQTHLEKKIPGITHLAGVDNIWCVESMLSGLDIRNDSSRNKFVLNFILPTLDPVLTFGGYTAILNFINRALDFGNRCRILILEDYDFSPSFVLEGCPPHKLINRILTDCETINCGKNRVPVGPGDAFFCYSLSHAHKAEQLSKVYERYLPCFFIQEDESIFHPHNSIHALIQASYDISHFPIFNSTLLARHFERSEIGVFKHTPASPHLIFNHSLTNTKRPSVETLKNRGVRKKILCYARPERHADRNLFELVVVALRIAAQKGIIDNSWHIDGVGTLSKKGYVDIHRGLKMHLHTKLGENDYSAMLSNYDIGISLMNAPHPSLLPFEMASVGQNVVTNTFSNRSEYDLEKLSCNIYPSSLCPESIANSIQKAINSLLCFEKRALGAKMIKSKPWEDIFNKDFMDSVFKSMPINK